MNIKITASFKDLIRVNPFMHNVVKWRKIILKSCGVHTARFLKYVWPLYNIMHESVKHPLFLNNGHKNLQKVLELVNS